MRLAHEGVGISYLAKMTTVPTALETRPTYENFEARCPHCREWITFNRISDLKTIVPIAGLEVRCLNRACAKSFWLTNDHINPAFEMFLFEGEEQWHRKRYTQTILMAVQAYEVFFGAVVRTWLLYRPFPNQRTHKLKLFNQLSELLYTKIRYHSFDAMRNLLFDVVTKGMKPTDLDEARSAIESLPDRQPRPTRSDITGRTSGGLQKNLLALYDSEANERRNLVAHKYAYRPTKGEAARALIEARNVIYGLKHDLGPELEFEDYANAPPNRP